MLTNFVITYGNIIIALQVYYAGGVAPFHFYKHPGEISPLNNGNAYQFGPLKSPCANSTKIQLL